MAAASSGGPELSLGQLFVESAARYPAHVALEVDGRACTYRELADDAGKIASVLRQAQRPAPLLGAVFASRSHTAYAGVLGTLLSGAGYVPLSAAFPDARNGYMLETSGCTTLVVDAGCASALAGVLAFGARPMLIVMPTIDDVSDHAARHPQHRFAGARELAAVAPIDETPQVAASAIAYLLFTSGSTGNPKGVMVSHGNVLSFLRAIWDRYPIVDRDRFSQMFDLTFDLSAFDLFAPWGRGASLHSVPAHEILFPDEFIRTRELTVWFSVPSVAMGMRRYRRLAPGSLPSLRLSLFCGERLPAETAAAWQAAAPASRVDNLYGPTEVTIACTGYRWLDETSPQEAVDGVVPIGRPLDGMTAAVVDSELQEVAAGERGELCLSGPQVALGYWQDDARTRERFVVMPWDPGRDRTWYRTGDVAFVNERGDLVHCGRTDDQIKLRGHRIELSEVEGALRRVSGSDLVAVVPFPVDEIGPVALTGAVCGASTDAASLQAAMRELVPSHMVPREILVLDQLPLNANGKIDKNQLVAMLRARKPALAVMADQRRGSSIAATQATIIGIVCGVCPMCPLG